MSAHEPPTVAPPQGESALDRDALERDPAAVALPQATGLIGYLARSPADRRKAAVGDLNRRVGNRQVTQMVARYRMQTLPRLQVAPDPRSRSRLLLRYEGQIVGTVDVKGGGTDKVVVRDRTQGQGGHITGLRIEILHDPAVKVEFDLWRRGWAGARIPHMLKDLKADVVPRKPPFPKDVETQLWPPLANLGPIQRPDPTPEEQEQFRKEREATAKALQPQRVRLRNLRIELDYAEEVFRLHKASEGWIEELLTGGVPGESLVSEAAILLQDSGDYLRLDLDAVRTLDKAEKKLAYAEKLMEDYRHKLIDRLETTLTVLEKTKKVGKITGSSIPGPVGRFFTLLYALADPPKTMEELADELQGAMGTFGGPPSGGGAPTPPGGGAPPAPGGGRPPGGGGGGGGGGGKGRTGGGGGGSGGKPPHEPTAPAAPSSPRRTAGLASRLEDAILREYTSALADLRQRHQNLEKLQETTGKIDPNWIPEAQAKIKTANRVLERIEERALRSTDPETSELAKHLDPLVREREALMLQGTKATSSGVRVKAEAVDRSPSNLRGMDFADIQRAMGRPPDKVVPPASSGKPSDPGTSHGRIEWHFKDRSKLVVDVPEKYNPDLAGRPATSRLPHAELHGPNGERLDQQGITVPEGSISAHMTITDQMRLTEKQHFAPARGKDPPTSPKRPNPPKKPSDDDDPEGP